MDPTSATPEPLSDAVLELMFRYELGDFPTNVRERLAQIFTDNPDDAIERLERAATYLGLTVLTPRTLERVDTDLQSRHQDQPLRPDADQPADHTPIEPDRSTLPKSINRANHTISLEAASEPPTITRPVAPHLSPHNTLTQEFTLPVANLHR